MTRFVLPFLVAALLSGSSALAQKADDGISAREKAQAKKAYQHALELYKNGDYKNAAIELRKAYDYAPLPPILYNLGVTYMKLGNKPAARAALSEYLNAMPNAANRDEVKQLLAELGGSDAPEPLENAAPAAPARKAAAEPPAETAPAAPQKPVVLGKDDDTENPLEHAAPQGARLSHTEGATSTTDTSEPGKYRYWKWGAAAGAVACVAIGALMLNQASQQADALNAAQAPAGGYPTTRYDQNVRDLEDGYSVNKTWGTISLVGGAALAATSVTLFVLDAKQPTTTRARITPSVGAGVATINLGGSF